MLRLFVTLAVSLALLTPLQACPKCSGQATTDQQQTVEKKAEKKKTNESKSEKKSEKFDPRGVAP